jgi:hypothetical protein
MLWGDPAAIGAGGVIAAVALVHGMVFTVE